MHRPDLQTRRPTLREHRCGSLAAHYRDAWEKHVLEEYRLGSSGTTLLNCDQSRGDWSDPAYPELVIGCLTSDPVNMTADFSAGLSRHRMVTRSFIVIPPGFATTILMDGAHSAHFLAIPYRTFFEQLPGSAELALPEDGDFGVLHSRVWTDRRTIAAMQAIVAEARAGNPHGTLGADGLLLQLIAAILRLRNRTADLKERSGLAPWQLKRVTELIEDDLARDLSLRDLAESVGLSPFHFCRAFSRSTGLPPHKWRLNRRLRRAEELLRHSGLPITAIALDLGFASSQHFAAAFKGTNGVSPSAYRLRSVEPWSPEGEAEFSHSR